ncbi:MAG: SIS domain-containing protein [Acidimicrobiia bacterium]|nr:SIS domain-containing protein [Acidimicrobiia bacterium]
MCGIIAVVRRPADRNPPEPGELLGPLDAARAKADGLAAGPGLAELLDEIAESLEGVDRDLRGVPGVRSLIARPGLAQSIEASLDVIAAAVDDLDQRFDLDAEEAVSEDLNAALLRVRDVVWAIGRDRLPTAAAVADLAGSTPSLGAVTVYSSVQIALAALDRLEVRGRDSAGLHLLVRDHALDLDDPAIRALLRSRSSDELFRSCSVRATDSELSFVYKAAAEIGELGDNTAVLRAAIAGDELLREAVSSDGADAVVLGHTRWASVGIISEANAHPLNSEQLDVEDAPYVIAALNGDVDNFADLKASESLTIPSAISTDAKVIPTMVSNRLAAGVDADEAFRQSVAEFEGSVAIAASIDTTPDRLQLALRGSGQALYVGLADDAFIVASEPYGLVEQTSRYLRIDGETPADPSNPIASRGQIVALDGSLAGEVGGITRLSYDGRRLPVQLGELVEAEITTRDIDRGEYPHFLLKEISEAPTSFRKTLRGRLVERDGALAVDLGDSLPATVRADLRAGRLAEVVVIGQGTAAVAGQSLARALIAQVGDRDVRVRALPATELSGFGLRDDMADTLVIAISQSGTTTDTNRTVDLVRDRGARVIAIVNRRGSDLTDKADGVLYTSDGRDVEMSVASTKAFYAQIAAGFLLASAIADELGIDAESTDRAGLLTALRSLPDAMEEVLATRRAIGEAARRSCPQRRYWAIVGNGTNRIAAEELRIKLSELCYKSIACDATEDKKHIDLSSEPLILVCAAGLQGSTADDVAKEVAIYAAHKAAPIVIANRDQTRFGAAVDVLSVPGIHSGVAFVLSTMVGHLFGYEAALAIDAQAQPLRVSRAAIERAVADDVPTDMLLATLKPVLEPAARRFFDGLRASAYDGHLEASTGARVASTYRYALGMIPLDAYQIDRGRVGTPAVIIEDLTSALTKAIEELTRPIDAIKHQAKTVTVGISRADETLLQVGLVGEVLAAGAHRDSLSYRTLRTLASLDPAVAAVSGFTRYRVEGEISGPDAQLVVVDRGGISLDLVSRTDSDPSLRGTKHRVAADQDVLVTTGRRDGRSILIVPEVKDGASIGLSLLHIRIVDRLDAATARGVLQGYGNRFSALRDAVTETEPTFRESLLAELPVSDLLVAPVPALADHWRV